MLANYRIFVVIFMLFFSGLAHATALSPVGIWKTIDDKTQKPRSIVEIWQQDNELRARILKVFYEPGESEKDVCVKCKGVNHNRLILGMTFMWGMRQQGDRWRGGKILDPKNGKIYNCTLSLSPDGQQLNVRGYIGVPLLGRTQTWFREVSNDNQ